MVAPWGDPEFECGKKKNKHTLFSLKSIFVCTYGSTYVYESKNVISVSGLYTT